MRGEHKVISDSPSGSSYIYFINAIKIIEGYMKRNIKNLL